MIRNQAGQTIGAQMVNATTGAAFAGVVTVYVTLDAGTQAIGTVGSGICTSEGNGYYTYAPSAAETNGYLAHRQAVTGEPERFFFLLGQNFLCLHESK